MLLLLDFRTSTTGEKLSLRFASNIQCEWNFLLPLNILKVTLLKSPLGKLIN